MFKIYKGGDTFFQWDIGQRLIVEDPEMDKIHFCNKTGECSLVCEVYEEDGLRLVNVPNILLQVPYMVRVYGCLVEGEESYFAKNVQIFKVIARTKPEDYVYTEEELKNWNSFDERLVLIEEDIAKIEALGYGELATQTDVAAVNKRVDNLVAENTLDSNAELIDIRSGADNTQYASAGAAVRAKVNKTDIVSTTGDSETKVMSQKAVTEQMSAIRDNYIEKMPVKLVIGGYSSSTGGTGAVTNRIRTGKLDISDVLISPTDGYSYLVLFWDADGNYLEGKFYPAKIDGSIVWAKGMTYVKDVAPEGSAKFAVLFKHDTITTFEDNMMEEVSNNICFYNYRNVCDELDALSNELKTPVNLFNPNDEGIETGGYYYLDYDKATWIASNTHSASGFIPITANETFIMGTTATTAKKISTVYYDKNKNVITGASQATTDSGAYVVPNNSNIAFVRVPFRNEWLNSYMVISSDIMPSYYIPYGKKTNFLDIANEVGVLSSEVDILSNDMTSLSDEVSTLSNNMTSLSDKVNQMEISHWNGKTWYAYGTSLTSTAQGKYVPYVVEFSGLNVTNKGIPGGALVSNRNIYNALMSETDGKANADLITIEVGANDSASPLGEVTSMDTATFCGALNTCLKNILTVCPKAQVVLMCSTRGRYTLADSVNFELGYTTGGGYTFEERDEAIRKIALINGVYYIPFGSGLGMGLFRMQSSNLYNVDNIHHTDLGGYNLAKGVWSYLKNIPLWYNELPQ